MTSLNQHTLQLQHGERRFTTFSNYSESEVFNTSKSRKWKRVIFLLHGFPDNNTTYNGIWPSLLEAFADDRVLLLAPLMRGYETTSLGPDKESVKVIVPPTSRHGLIVLSLARFQYIWLDTIGVPVLPIKRHPCILIP